MSTVRPEQIDVVVATSGDQDASSIAEILGRSGFRTHNVAIGLDGLSRVAEIKPSAIVLVSLGNAQQEWVLNFVDGNPDAPAIVAVGPSSLLADAPDWLYDVVSPNEVHEALDHRVKLSVAFYDMRRLAAMSAEELGRSGAHIRLVSMIDMATGLFNRRYFQKHLRESYAGARRYKRPLTCMLVRVNGLADLIIRLGPELTNDVLDSIARAIKSVIREADIAARIDDDLFGFLLPETTGEGADGLVQRLEARLKTAKYPNDVDVSVSTAYLQLDNSHTHGDALLDATLEQLIA